VNTLIALLAAGKSTRFHGVKLAQLVDELGTSLLEDSYHKLKWVADKSDAQLVVILGGHEKQLSPLLPDDAEYVVNHEFAMGLSTSIYQAVCFAEKYNMDNLLIALADQIAITTDEYLSLLQALSLKSRVCVIFDKALSVPAIFCRDDFDKLAALSGDNGAKSILMALNQAGKLHTVEMSSAAFDIDTPNELASWISANNLL